MILTLAPKYAIVPLPVEMVEKQGAFSIKVETKIFVEAGLEGEASFLAERWGNTKVVPAGTSTLVAGGVLLTTQNADSTVGDEGYVLEVAPRSIVIRATKSIGVFRGVQSLIQLRAANGDSIPAVHVRDYPRFSWRGMHLDVGRHFFPVDAIKRYIDTLVFFKMSVFHWHLTEDQGWRIEIKKHPLLTKISAWRKETVGRPETMIPDGIPYGGFYTQNEVRDVVAYAADRHVTVVPEIEMPGHSSEVLAAYPHLACDTPTNILARQAGKNPFEVSTIWGVRDDIFCAGKEETYQFVQNVLDEVLEMFPSKFIHIGGDEAPKTRWKECPRCQEKITAEKIKGEHELQSYFVRRIDKYLTSKGRRLVGWDEILEGGLAENATVMSWRGIEGGIAAANSGHDAVMTPTSHCYLDYYQSRRPGEPEAIGGFVDLEKVYSYEPVPPQVAPPLAKHILGVQGNVWTEFIKDAHQVEYMAWPRGAALAEIGWSPPERKDFHDFVRRWSALSPHLASRGVNFYSSSPRVTKPAATVSTTLVPLDGKPASCAFDGDPNTQFVSKGGVAVGDTFAIVLSSPLSVQQIEFRFGPLGNALRGGEIDVSTDGKEWRSVLVAGGQNISVEFGPTAIIGVRLRITVASPHRLVVREINLSSGSAGNRGTRTWASS